LAGSKESLMIFSLGLPGSFSCAQVGATLSTALRSAACCEVFRVQFLVMCSLTLVHDFSESGDTFPAFFILAISFLITCFLTFIGMVVLGVRMLEKLTPNRHA